MSVKIIAVNPPSLTRFATGVYTGDGAATQSITGVGFQPRFVLIYRQYDSTSNDFGWKTDQDGLNAFFSDIVTFRHRYQTDQIVSLDADGFTVGDGTPFGANIFNIADSDYTYVAFA